MTETVVNGKETRCLFINNGDDLLTLKKVVSKKSDKDEAEKQKNNKTKEINGSELNGTHNKTDSINFDVDNTSSLEPNLEMDSDTDRNITIDDSTCTQEDRELDNIDVSNDNSNEADVKNEDKDNEAMAIQNSSILIYSPSKTLDNIEYSCDLENDDLEDIKSPSLSVSYFNISSREPLHTDTDFDITLEEGIKPLKTHILMNEKKRKRENIPEQLHTPSKMLKLWSWVKSPFQKVTIGTPVCQYETSNISKAEDMIEKENHVGTAVVSENNSETEELNESTDIDSEEETKEESYESAVDKKKFCSIM